MARQRQLARPPLREAVIDIQLTEQLPVSFAEDLKDKVIPGYERKHQINFGQFSFDVGSGQSSGKQELAGWRYELPDASRMVQVRRNGMTYSILRDYTEWAEIKAATRQIWNLYRQWAGNVEIGRTAARYINVFDFPVGTELDDYLTAAPKIPEELPQKLDSFLARVVVPFEHNISAIITQAVEPSVQPAVRVIVDIDVYAQRVFAADSVELWDFIDRLRQVKNAIFFSLVTERTLEAYE